MCKNVPAVMKRECIPFIKWNTEVEKRGHGKNLSNLPVRYWLRSVESMLCLSDFITCLPVCLKTKNNKKGNHNENNEKN